jgi:hypothetical protein
MKNTKQLGFNYLYHYNEFDGWWYCIHRDSIFNYWNRQPNLPSNWTSGIDVESAAGEMIRKEEKNLLHAN